MATSPRLIEMVGRLVVEVLPSKSEHFVATHAGERCQPQGREEPVPGGGSQEGAELFSGPGTLFDSGDGPQAWGVGDEGHVARDEPAPDGVAERAADDQVHLVDRLGCEGAVPVARVEQPVVERLEVVWAQAPQTDASEGGDDVPLDVAAVAVIGASSEHEPLARQPPAGQEGTEAQ
jgi:hypothetical protein